MIVQFDKFDSHLARPAELATILRMSRDHTHYQALGRSFRHGVLPVPVYHTAVKVRDRVRRRLVLYDLVSPPYRTHWGSLLATPARSPGSYLTVGAPSYVRITFDDVEPQRFLADVSVNHVEPERVSS